MSEKVLFLPTLTTETRKLLLLLLRVVTVSHLQGSLDHVRVQADSHSVTSCLEGLHGGEGQ